MAIFGNRNKDVLETVIEGMQPTSACLEGILTESAQESYQIRAGLYVSDVIMEEAIFEGSATPEVLMEGLGNDIWTKIKAMFTKLWNKIKSWFEAIKRHLALIFKSGVEFVEKFEKEIRAKVTKGFKYKGYKYTLGAGSKATEDLCNKADGLSEKYENGITDASKIVTADPHEKALKDNMGSMKDSYKTSDEKESILKTLGGDTVEEIMKDLAKKFRNGKDETEEFSDFAGNSKEEMIGHIKNKDKIIASCETSQKGMNTMVERVIKAIETASGRFKGEEAGKVAPYVSHSAEILRFTISIATSALKVEIDASKEAAKDFESTLKSFLRFKPAKEGFGGEEIVNNGGTSILEAAMKLV